MASKWAFLSDLKDPATGQPLYPKLQEESEYQAKINVVKDDFRGRVEQHEGFGSSHAKLVAMYEEACEQYDRIKEMEKQNNLEIAALEQMLGDNMVALGIEDGFKSEGFTYFKQSAPYPKVVDKVKLRKHMMETGQEDLLSLNPQTLKGIVSEALGPTGSRVIPDGVEVFVKESISRRKR